MSPRDYWPSLQPQQTFLKQRPPEMNANSASGDKAIHERSDLDLTMLFLAPPLTPWQTDQKHTEAKKTFHNFSVL